MSENRKEDLYKILKEIFFFLVVFQLISVLLADHKTTLFPKPETQTFPPVPFSITVPLLSQIYLLPFLSNLLWLYNYRIH